MAKIAGDHGIGNLMLEDVEQTRRELHDKVQASDLEPFSLDFCRQYDDMI